MNWLLLVVIGLLGFVAALISAAILLLIFDAVLRLLFWRNEQAVDMEVLAPDGSSTTFIVYLPGILASATMMPERLVKTMAQFGEVWGVNYLSPRFRPKRIISVVSRWIIACCEKDPRIEHVILVGSSMGGLLAYDINKKLSKSPLMKNVEIGIMAIDAPTESKDLQPPFDFLSPFVRIIPFGPLSNLLRKPIMKRLVIPPKEGEIDYDIDREWLEQQVEGARSFLPSFWYDQTMYIVRHGALAANSIDCPVVYIRSTEDDDTVKPEAADSWQQAVSPISPVSFMLDAEGAKHAAYAQNPSAYEEVLPFAFRLLIGY